MNVQIRRIEMKDKRRQTLFRLPFVPGIAEVSNIGRWRYFCPDSNIIIIIITTFISQSRALMFTFQIYIHHMHTIQSNRIIPNKLEQSLTSQNDLINNRDHAKSA